MEQARKGKVPEPAETSGLVAAARAREKVVAAAGLKADDKSAAKVAGRGKDKAQGRNKIVRYPARKGRYRVMRIAVTTTEPSLNCQMDSRFGRCSYFLIVDTEDLSVEAVENPFAALDSDAGVQSAQLIAEKGAEFVLTGNCGPRGHLSLSTVGIGVILGCSGVAREVVELFKKEQGPAADKPNVPRGFGTGESLASLMYKYPHSRQEMPMTDKSRTSGCGDSGGCGQRSKVAVGVRETAHTWPPGPIPPEYRCPPANWSKQHQLESLECRAKEVRREMRGLRERIRRLKKELQT